MPTAPAHPRAPVGLIPVGFSTPRLQQVGWLARLIQRGIAIGLLLGFSGLPVTGQTSVMTRSVGSEVSWEPPLAGAWLGGYRSRDPWTSWDQFIADHEAMIGRELDVLRHFRRMQSGHTALTPQMIGFVQSGRRLLLSWKPGSDSQEQWSNSAGTQSEHCADLAICQIVDDNLRELADSIAAIKPRQILLTIWHEPENNVDGHVCSGEACKGTEQEYVAMWHNVRAIFDAQGADNVTWVWTVTGYSGHFALLPDLWPGNERVDWLMWDPYLAGTGDTDIVSKIETGYQYFLENSDAAHDYSSKPWGLAEWGTGLEPNMSSPEEQAMAFAQLETALNQDEAFPRLKIFAYFDARSSVIEEEPAISAYRSLANSPHFKRLFNDGFESGGTSAWSATVP